MKSTARLLVAPAVAIFGLATFAPAAEPANFIFISIDDLGYGDIGPFGSTLNRTPNLDRMAREGRRLTSFYAASVCTPSRASLLTGSYSKRALPVRGVLFPSGKEGLNPAEITVAELLRDRGYATACIGKWHLGDQPEFLPTRQGFDYYLGLPYSNSQGPAEDGAQANLGGLQPQGRFGQDRPAATKKGGKAEPVLPPLPLLENETVVARVRQDEQQDIVRRYTEAAVKFLRKNQDRRFFLYLAHSAVHNPIYPGKDWAGRSPHGIYSDWVEEMDWSIGQVLAAVRDLGLAGKTLVIFTSDNGGKPYASNAPLRGAKNSTWEGGVRVPTIAWWPGKIPAGTTADDICGMIDILPTFVQLAGGKIPSDRKLDGTDIQATLLGQPGAGPPREAFYYFRDLKLEAVRSGPWKLHLNRRPLSLKDEREKAATGNLLFNLDQDIGENHDVAAANPDVMKRLLALADLMKDDLGLDGVGPGCRPPGRVTAPRPLIGFDGTIRPGFAPAN